MEEKTVAERMKDLMEMQGSPGNWDYDPYMHGMYNGMELFFSMVEDRDPAFREQPEEWGRDKSSEEEFVLGLLDTALGLSEKESTEDVEKEQS